MEQLSQVIRNNQEWLQNLYSGHHEIRQIMEEFTAHLQGVHGDIASPRIVTGHQPVIYYPGLLFKDYFVGEMAQNEGGSAWNFIVDTDVADLEVPIPHYAHGKLQKSLISIPNPENLAFTSLQPSRPETDQFLQTIQQHLAALPHPQIKSAFRKFKQNLYDLLEDGFRFTDALSYLRNKQDAEMGPPITDHKISELVGSYPYAHYIWYIIKNIDSYTRLYNDAVEQEKKQDYQPVKFLRYQDGWYELPFWLVKDGKRLPVQLYKDRGHLFFRTERSHSDITFDVGNKNEHTIIESLRTSLKLYPKATTLTQVIRLFLSDIFVHGKGAVEYEKVNNLFLQSFFSMSNLGTFLSVTGDIHLPLMENLPDYDNLQKDYKQKQKWLKQVERNPEEYLENNLAEQYKEKKKAIARQMANENSQEQRKLYHRRLEHLDEQMKSHLAGKIEPTRKQVHHYEEILQKKDVLYERQYPYFLYPDEWLTREQFDKNIRINIRQ